MTITKEDIHAALARLAEWFPQTFALEKYLPHRPLKVGIHPDILARCPALTRRELGPSLRAYTRRIIYLQGLVAGAVRVDLDGNPAGEVSAADAEHAAATLAEILAARETKPAAAVAVKRAVRIARNPAVPAPPAATPPAARTLKDKPVLRLPAFRQQCG
jgi:ProP effector